MFLLIVVVVLMLLALVYWNGVKNYSLIADIPLNGPKPWPYVGNLFDVFKYGGMHKQLLAYFKRYGRVHKMYIGRRPTIVVNDPEMVKIITVKEFSKFRNRPQFIKLHPPFSSALFFSRDDDWKRIRTTLTPTFSASKLKQIVPIIEKSCAQLDKKMDKFAETGKHNYLAQCRRDEVRNWAS
jgi:cytochrome P450